MEKLTLRIKRIAVLLVCLCLCLSGCAKSRSLPDYRASAFGVEIVYSTPHTKLVATAEVSAPRAEETIPRDVTLTLSSPKALQGLMLQRTDGKISLNYEGILTESDATGLLRCVDLLLTEGRIKVGNPCQRNGTTLLYAEIQNDKDTQIYELYLTPHTGIPQELVVAEETIQIRKFQIFPE